MQNELCLTKYEEVLIERQLSPWYPTRIDTVRRTTQVFFALTLLGEFYCCIQCSLFL